MELSLSGNALKTFTRSVTCLARVGTELVLVASPSKLELHTLNSSRSAYQTVSFHPGSFDIYILSSSSSSSSIRCSVLLKSLCSVLRTPAAALDRIAVALPSPDAAKLQCTLHCLSGAKKTYWITCNVDPDVQQLSLDRRRFPSSLIVRPRDLARLLANFQSSLQEITIIATETSAAPSDSRDEIGRKAVELRSYIDPTKDNSDATLHTQLWIDPAEEFFQYTHTGDPVDVTFGSAAKSSDTIRGKQVQDEGNPSSIIPNDQQTPNMINVPGVPAAQEDTLDTQQPMETDDRDKTQDRADMHGNPYSQHHPSNWVGAVDDEDDDDDEELCVQIKNLIDRKPAEA
ncbi:hypothetical protein C4D60_Mb09t14990 [Musa balbisiana]|uniref:Uncharacterized protein n=1 Tax=Musa balbisiana TaxID=52838 RepID=A0A4S8IGM1_MUSBA|nr:hypothetical protein C4D60_Mb09t14990 [Musa balbisiana]